MENKKTIYRILFSIGNYDNLKKEFDETFNTLFKYGYVLGGRRYKSLDEAYRSGVRTSDGVLFFYDNECRMVVFLTSRGYNYYDYSIVDTNLKEFLEKYHKD